MVWKTSYTKKMVKRKHKTLYLAKKERDLANKGFDNGYNVYPIKKASVWKYVVCTHLEWINGFY